ncbi:MAG: fatty acyl-AMP ligase [Nitrospirales bacterium]|nr:fatty acyl-AMP ligase [Nitrospirales bacterium]
MLTEEWLRDRTETLCPDLQAVWDCLDFHCSRNPHGLCCSLRSGGGWQDYTRGEFSRYVDRYCLLFSSILHSPTLILFIKKPDIHLLAAYIGAMKAGHLPAQISPPTIKLSEEEYLRKMRHIRAITGFGAVFTDREEKDRYASVCTSVLSPEDLPDRMGRIRPVRTEDALVQFSSGSTGLQKGVVLSHGGLVAHMKSYAEALRLTNEDAIVTWLPLYHDMGLIACFLMPLMCGIPFYQMDPFDWIFQPDLLLKTIEERRPTICFLPNFAYHLLAAKGLPHDLSSVRLWVNCSEPARMHSHELFMAKFPTVRPESLTVCYALAENTFAVSQTLPWHANSTRPHPGRGVLSCGRPVRGVEVRIFPSDNGSDGEIGVRSPSLFLRFLDGSLPLKEGYYLTGDLGFMDERGEVFITGRKKDLIIVNGKNIFPQDVEHALPEVPGVYPGRAVAFGVWDEDTGSEDLIVIAERKEEAVPTQLKLAVQKAVQKETGIVPRRVEIVEHMTLVKTSSGKLSRSRNRDLYMAKELKLL